MMKQPFSSLTFCVFALTLTLTSVMQAQTLNKKDDQGRRHGAWKGYYEDNPEALKYEGTFDHGNEIGVFRFYKPGLENPVALKRFSDTTDSVKVEYISQTGDIISEGHMVGRHRVGPWKYYHKNSDQLMALEHYQEGILQGEKLTYYDSGALAEKAFYQSGKLHGERVLYSEEGVILEHLTYRHGELHGPARFYDATGQLEAEGNYKNNKHHGTWKYYADGKLKEEKEFE